MKSIFLGLDERVHYVYTDGQINWLRQNAGLTDTRVYTGADIDADPAAFADVEWVFSTWGMFDLTAAQLDAMPRLKGVFYAAGSVQHFARSLLGRGVRVFSAWQANAVPVAEFTVSQVLLANTGYFASMQLRSAGRQQQAAAVANTYPGNYGCRVGILAAGVIGRMVIKALAARKLEVLVYDPYISQETAAALGARKAELDEIFATCQTVSNHIPNLPDNKRMLTYDHFAAMLPNATFINTGRGAQVDDAGLIRALTEAPTRMALIDVTDPEVLPQDHPFHTMPNVLLTPHIAGSMNDEVHRMADYMIEEFTRVTAGAQPLYEVSEEMLKTMA